MRSGHPSAGKGRRLLLVLATSVGLVLSVRPALTQESGGFLEKADSRAVRAPWTRTQIEGFLPSRGRFTFPLPYNTAAVRLTSATDCAGTDCVMPWAGRNINNHRGRATMLVFLGLRGIGPTLFSYDKATDEIVRLGPLFDPSSPLASASGEGWYFSATRPAALYLSAPLSARLQRYDVLSKTFETVFDAATQFGEGKYISQPQSSDDDKAHSATLRDLSSHATLGCLAYREDSYQFFFHHAAEDFAECQIDKSGRWLVIKEDLDGIPGRDSLIVDLETGAETVLLGEEGAGGPSDNGYGYMVAADGRKGSPGPVRVWDFARSPLQGTVVYPMPPSAGGAGYITHSNAQPGVPLSRQHACAAHATTAVSPRGNEIVCFRLDGSSDALVVAPSMTDLNARGGGEGNRKGPRGSLDVTGGYFLWVTNMGGDRADAFMVKVPAGLLAGASPHARPSGPIQPMPAESVNDEPPLPPPSAAIPDPLLLPIATTLQVPLVAAYNLLNVPSLPAGGSYLDPVTGVKIYKLTSATYPTSSLHWGHDYGEGNDEVSLPYNGTTRAVLLRQSSSTGGPWWIVDFTPGVGVSNPRQLSGNAAPWVSLAFTFSNNPATPYYAYVARAGAIRRIDFRTMIEVPGGGWPVTGETDPIWLHQSENDGMFTWMRGATGSTIVAYEPSTSTKKTYTNANLNEPRIDRAGRYVGISMSTPQNQAIIWDFNTGAVSWSTPDGSIPFAHQASLKRRWMSVHWGLSWPGQFTKFIADVPNSAQTIGGPANGSLTYANGNWIQSPANLDDQWALFSHYGSLQPTGSTWLAPGGMILVNANGGRRLLAHPYNTSGEYDYYSFPKFSPDGKYVLFTSDMNGTARSDVFLAEMPEVANPDTTPPTVSLTAPGAGATVSGTAVAVSANASDNLAVVGVQFKLDGGNLGAEDLLAPYGVSWNTTLTTNGSHSLTAVARDAAGNTRTSTAVNVTVNNAPDTTPPVITAVAASGIASSLATIVWTTNEPADTQVEYGPTTAYGSSTTLNASLLLAHSQLLVSLTPTTLYHYRVRSRDAAGNLAVSGDFTFTTLGFDAGLVVRLRLDEGSGTSAADASGNGNTGTLMNGALWAAGSNGQAVALDGVNDYVRIPHAATLNAFPLSAMVFFKTSATSGVVGLVNKYVASSSDGYQIFINNGNLCAWYYRDASNYVYDNGGCTMQTAGYNDGLWHQATLVVDALGGRLYVDGVQKATQPWTGLAGPPATTQELRLGHYPGAFGGVEYLAGTVDELRIYDRALTAGDVQQIYNTDRDTTSPLISSVAATGITGTGATIVWTTNEAADTQVEYGPTTAYGSSTPLNAALVTSHGQALTGLAASSLYHYRVKSRDGAGNLATSPDFTFTTLDGVPPVISGVSASGVTTAGATIVWTTNETADTQVEYGTTTAYGSSTTLNPALVTSHGQALTGLGSSTLYHYRVKSKDAAGNLAVSGDFTFTTLDGVAPVISGVSATSLTTLGATIVWNTNEAADSQVEYGPTTSYAFSTSLNPSLVGAHSQGLTGLAPGTLYHYRVKSRDAAGNLAVSPDFTFTTLSAPASPIALLRLDEGSGTGAADASGNGNNGTLMNGPTWTTGSTGKGVALDGADDYVRIPHAAALNAFPLTVSVWFKTSTTTGFRGLVNKYVSGSFNGYQIYFYGGNLCAWYMKDAANYIYDATSCPMSVSGYNDSQWHQAALVVDAAGGRLYVDGVQKGSRAWTGVAGPPSTAQEIRLGNYPGDSCVAGTLDELRLYNRALSDDEIRQLHGPIAHLTLDEGSGTAAADTSGNGNNGTLTNGPTWTTGAAGRGVALDGADDYVRIAHTGALNAFPLTVSVWFKTSTTTGVRGLVNKYVAGSFNGYQVYFNGGNLCAWFMRDAANYVFDGTGCTLSAAGYNDGQWHQAAFVVDAAGGRLYVDGAQTGSRAWTGLAGPPSTAQEIRLGHYPGDSFIAGMFDDLRLYDRALSAAEVRQLGEPIAHLKLDEGSGTGAADASGNGHTGTLMNGAAWSAGITGQGAVLDGVDDYVRIPHATALNAFPLTVSVWFKTTAATGVRGLVNKYVAGSFNGYQIYFNGGILCAWFMRDAANYIFDGTGCPLSAAGYNNGQWHRATFVIDATGGRLYVDGVQQASRAWTGVAGAATTAQDVHLGDYTGSYLPATVDELRIYNRALSAAEVLALSP